MPLWQKLGDLQEGINRISILVYGCVFALFALAGTIEGLLQWKNIYFVSAFYAVCALSVLITLVYHYLKCIEAIRVVSYLKHEWSDAFLLIVMALALWLRTEIFAIFAILRHSVLGVRIFLRSTRGQRVIESLVQNPAKVVVFSFLLLIALGTIFFMFPRATVDMKGLRFMDALFTSTSATCVTGLTVIVTSKDALAPHGVPALSFFGQIVLLLLIQAGGLGIMTLSTSAALLLGGRLSARGARVMQDVLDEETPVGVQTLVRQTVLMTFAIESAGALALSFRFLEEFSDEPAQAVFYGIFHAISAFCNAGFSLYSQNLTSFMDDKAMVLIVSSLIILGGLGFLVNAAILSPSRYKKGFRAFVRGLPLHAKLVLVTTAILIFSGTVLLLLLDRNGAQQGLSFEDRLWASFFQSVSARTCGFNTVDLSKTSRSAVFVYLALMFIGASPGGTGGGIKTTTAALLILNIRAILLGREQVEVFGRTVPGKTIRKAIAISTLSFAACFLVALLLLATQKGISMESLLFETVSAFGTVGLSMGATMKLDTFGRLCIIFLMFVGRVGPLTLTLALGQRPVQSGIRFPQERVTVG